MILKARRLQLGGRWDLWQEVRCKGPGSLWELSEACGHILDAVVRKSSGEGQTDEEMNKVISTTNEEE